MSEQQQLPQALEEVNLPQEWGLERRQGKVRDIYEFPNDRLALIATDRLTAFDRPLGFIPNRGQILTELSQWWFDMTKDIVPNHMVDVPDPNVMVVRRLLPIRLEMVVRRFLTGTTDTSIWRRYERGERTIGGMKLPEKMKKNEQLLHPIVDPTTKAQEGHDKKMTEDEILESGIATPLEWQALKSTSFALFARGQELARRADLILVDTKYEFGRDLATGSIVVIDEVHTPDSSRFWGLSTYEQRLNENREPDIFDKEFVRLWYTGQGYRGEGPAPKMPESLIREARDRYIFAYERLTGQTFDVPIGNPEERIIKNLKGLVFVN